MNVKNFHGKSVIDSREVAEMVGRSHSELLKSIRIYADYLAEGEIPLGDFFIESTYLDSNNQFWIAIISLARTFLSRRKVAT